MLASLLTRLHNASLARKIQLIVLPSMVLLVAVVLLELWQNMRSIRDAQVTAQVVELAAVLDGVAHNHAVERGLTAGFLASGGELGADKLSTQRQKADVSREALIAELDSSFVLSLPPAMREHLQELAGELAYVPELRKQVDQLDASNSPFLIYSAINKMSLDAIDELSSMIRDMEVVKGLQALVGLLWLKERSGQERGALNGVFASGTYSMDKLLSVNHYINDQGAQLDYISRNMSSEQFSQLMEQMSSSANSEVLRLRQGFFDAVAGERLMPRDANHWFQVSTQRIKKIKAVADSLSASVDKTAHAKARKAMFLFCVLAVGAGLICWLIYRFSSWVSEQIRRRVTELTHKLNEVAQVKDFSQRINEQASDEIGLAAHAFNSLLHELQRAIEAVTSTVSNVASGKFDTRINERFDGDLAVLKQGVNQSSEKVEQTMAALAEVMQALAQGRFDARMSHAVEGEFKQQVDGAMQATEAAINSVAGVIGAMSQGDFSARIDKPLPGVLGELKRSVNASLDNIAAAMTDISDCVQAQKLGQFSWRIRNDYSGDLQQLKNGINDSMQSIDEALQDLNQIFRRIRSGDYSMRIDRAMSGDLGEMKDGINASLNELDAAIGEIVDVASAQQQGRLDARISGEYQGQLAELKNSLNSSGATLNLTVDLISELMFKMQAGDFSGRIQVPMLGVFDDLKLAINESLASLQHAVRDLTRIATAQKKGELFQRMEDGHVGELAVIRDAVNASMSNLSDIVQQVQQSSTHTLSMTSDQSSATFEMSRRTESQAAALQQIASTMEQIAAAAGNTEQRCTQIGEQFNKAIGASDSSLKTVDETVSSMEQMRASSQKIASITSMIDEIAFQTNLLALNAAVEAARAGEQGRGFAVVAAEVRELAQRSSDAARSIKELIADNDKKVDVAWELSQKSKQNLGHIAEVLASSSELTREVSRAATEQNQGVQEINSAISSLDSMTQENAAMVEQSKAATKSVEDQSERMHALLGFFVLRHSA
ncbi:methyl-accepting chemotaxis protein [Agaribacterium haliotis]|uniref:methyl-accepting chemotaxis protein n=1 Tax=Agaribacterium haliotis TaxID=2013869 RepID=UPI000BB54DA3|nr:methyl-accepting chemotaxis protein [Agaribacterium haliotis]